MFDVLRQEVPRHRNLYLRLKASNKTIIRHMKRGIEQWNSMPWIEPIWERNKTSDYSEVIVTAASLIYVMTQPLHSIRELLYQSLVLPTEDAETWIMGDSNDLSQMLVSNNWWSRVVLEKIFRCDAIERLRSMQPLPWEWRRALIHLFPDDDQQLEFKPFSIPLITLAEKIQGEDLGDVYYANSIHIKDANPVAKVWTTSLEYDKGRCLTIEKTESTVQEIFRQCQEVDKHARWWSMSWIEMNGFFEPTVTFTSQTESRE